MSCASFTKNHPGNFVRKIYISMLLVCHDFYMFSARFSRLCRPDPVTGFCTFFPPPVTTSFILLMARDVFEPRKATGSELFPYNLSSHYHISMFSLLETISLKIWEKLLSSHAKCSLPVAVRGSKIRVPFYLCGACDPSALARMF